MAPHSTAPTILRFPRGLQGFRHSFAGELQPTGISNLDAILCGGIPRGSIVELCSSASSGRTSLTLSMLANATERQETCAYIDVSDALDPMSVASAGVDLKRLLWIRCGPDTSSPLQPQQSLSSTPPRNNSLPLLENSAAKAKSQLWQHPRDQIRGIETSLPSLMRNTEKTKTQLQPLQTHSATLLFTEPANAPHVLHCASTSQKFDESSTANQVQHRDLQKTRASSSNKPWKRLEQALKVTDLLLHSGGWGFVVFDLGNISWVDARRIELSTWFRFRRAIENTPTILLLLGEESCAKSCSSLVLQCQRKNENWNYANPQSSAAGVATLAGFEVEGKILCSRTGLQPMDSARWNATSSTGLSLCGLNQF
jgi:recombination protein RecA